MGLTIYFGLQCFVTGYHIQLLHGMQADPSINTDVTMLLEGYEHPASGRCGRGWIDLPRLSPARAQLIGQWQTLNLGRRILLMVVTLFHVVMIPMSWFITVVYWCVLAPQISSLWDFTNVSVHAVNSVLVRNRHDMFVHMDSLLASINR